MGRKITRDANGKFARTDGTASAKSKPERSTAKKIAIGAGIAVGLAAASGGLKVRSDALARYDARTAASMLRAADITSSW
jgi:hypothetical protein